jgi:ketosteroid isomerase-like protein
MLADDVLFEHPAGCAARGRKPAPSSMPVGSPRSRTRTWRSRASHVIDDVAVEEATYTATHDGVLRSPTGDVPPTGRSVSVDYIQVLRFRGGKHCSFNLMFDRLLMLEQLGLIPAPASAR